MTKSLLNILIFAMAIYGCTNVQNEQKRDEVKSDFTGKLTQEEIDGGRLTPEILWKFGRLTSAQLSPDGKQVVYAVSQYDAKTVKNTSNLFVVPFEGGEPKKITEDQFLDLAPVWTPCGKIAFLSKRYETMQVWVMNADGSERKQITDVEGGIDAFKISPDKKHLMYTKRVKLEQSVTEKHSDLDKANAMLADDLMYRHWNHWKDYKFSHIFIAEMGDKIIKEGKDIMENEKYESPLAPYYDDSEIVWSPDGKTLAYVSKKQYGREFAVSTNSDIYLYDITSGETQNITQENKGYDRYPVFSPKGDKIAYMSMETPGYEADKERLLVYNIADKSREYINSNWDQNAHNYVWDENQENIYFISGKNATHQIYKVHLKDKAFAAITKGQHDYNSFSKIGDKLIGSKTKHQMAAEVFTINESTGEETQLTKINQNIYDKIKLGHSEERWVKTTDGKDMLVWLIFPPNFDANKKYPAILYCQGGPQSAVSQFFSYRWNFSIMAANDYIIIAPNRRGLPSFGQEWNAQISTDYYGQNIKDYLSAADALKKESFIDEDRLGCVGASYGGYSTFFLAGHHQKRFKAFISHCGMYNLESFYAATEETFFPNHDLGGAYWDLDNKVAQKSFAHSPHRFVQNWDTPILIIHGGNDFRIPYTESLQAFNAAQLRGIPSRLLYFPEETHFVSQAQNSILWQREFFEWLDKYLK